METLENVRRYLFRDWKVMFEENVRTVAGAREVSSEGDQCELYLYQHRLPPTDSFTTFLFGFCVFSGLRKARFCIFYFKLNFLSTCLILPVKVSHWTFVCEWRKCTVQSCYYYLRYFSLVKHF